ncbi:PRD domain protein [Clostridioides difficile CD160]|nr:PRD domain protein [Clostridioides difficile CD160]
MRERIILETLKNSSGYLNIDYFADKLGVSTRTIRNEIKKIETIKECNGFKLEYKSKLGYILNIKDQDKFEHYLKNLPSDLVENPEQRLESIIVELLINEGYKTIEQLSKKFLVSSSQIKNDLKKVDEKIKDTELKLERKAHYGIKIEGSVKEIQSILVESYFKGNRNITEYRNKFIDNFKLDNIRSTIKNVLNEHNLEVNLTELEEILAQIIILYIRVSMRVVRDINDLDLYTEDLIIDDLLDKIFKDKKYNLTHDEKYYLKQLIKLRTKDKKATIKNIDKNKLQDIMYEFFRDIDKKYDSNFLEDKEFLNLFYLHIACLIERIKKNHKIINPFSVKISQQYPTVFNLSIQFSKIIENEYHIKISQDEIGFIATHIAVPFEKREEANFNKKYKIAIICSSGGGSAFLINLRLKEIFPNADIKNFSLLEEKAVVEFAPDLIFSITNLLFEINTPVILINEILDELDYLDIKESIRFAEHIGNISSPKQYILGLFDKNHFRCIKDKFKYKDILDSMSQCIVDEGACSPTYPKDVWERESYLSTIYTNGVAIPHPIEMTGNKNIISVALIQTDISYENRVPKIIFMISLIKGNLELHKQISKYLSKIMTDKDMVDMLNKSQSYEEFMYKLKIYLGG